MREAASDLDFEEAARLRDELKRLRATELAVSDNPTTKTVNLNAPHSRGRSGKSSRVDPTSRPHKPSLDEMGVASYHEVLPDRPGKKDGVVVTRRISPIWIRWARAWRVAFRIAEGDLGGAETTGRRAALQRRQGRFARRLDQQEVQKK